MPKLKSGRYTSGLKELRKAHRRTKLNRQKKKLAYKWIRKVKQAVKAKDINSAKEALREAISQLDKLAKCNIIHKNSANRKKSHLMKLVNTLGSQLTN